MAHQPGRVGLVTPRMAFGSYCHSLGSLLLKATLLPPYVGHEISRDLEMSRSGSELSELYDSALVRWRYRLLAGSQRPALVVFKLLETRGPLPVRRIIELSGYKKTRVYEALKLLNSQGIIGVHKGLCYLSS